MGIKITGLHLLLSYQCTLECDHCFTWGSPWQSGTMNLDTVRHLLRQAQDVGTVQGIYFEGGEPFLFYPILLAGVREAADTGFETGIVTNSYWATTAEDAEVWLRPFVGVLGSLSASSDLYHWNERLSRRARNAQAAAEKLGISLGFLSIAQPGEKKEGESAIMYRGRASERLIDRVVHQPWEQFTECPYENLREPGRLHVDPFGHMHICQGISVGNLLQRPLSEISASCDPAAHPITGPLIDGGPAELVRRYGLAHEERYADACHLCYEARRSLRSRYPEILTPDQMYGVA